MIWIINEEKEKNKKTKTKKQKKPLWRNVLQGLPSLWKPTLWRHVFQGGLPSIEKSSLWRNVFQGLPSIWTPTLWRHVCIALKNHRLWRNVLRGGLSSIEKSTLWRNVLQGLPSIGNQRYHEMSKPHTTITDNRRDADARMPNHHPQPHSFQHNILPDTIGNAPSSVQTLPQGQCNMNGYIELSFGTFYVDT